MDLYGTATLGEDDVLCCAQDFHFIVWPVWNSWQTATICKLTVPTIRDPILIIRAREMIIPVYLCKSSFLVSLNSSQNLTFREWWPNLSLKTLWQKVSLKVLTFTSGTKSSPNNWHISAFFPFTIFRNPLSRSKWIALFVYIIVKTPSSPTLCSCIAWFYIFHNWAIQQDLFHY